MPKPTRTHIDLTQVEILPFSDRTVYNRFTCGKRPLDQFLNKARKSVKRNEHRVFCAHFNGSPSIVGYYALQVGGDSVSELPDASKDNYLKNYTAFPAIHLSFVAVHKDYQRQGLGEFLLMDVFSKVAAISDCAGFFALTLMSLDEESTAFYESLDFRAYSDHPKQPKMLYPLEDLLSLVRGDGT